MVQFSSTEGVQCTSIYNKMNFYIFMSVFDLSDPFQDRKMNFVHEFVLASNFSNYFLIQNCITTHKVFQYGTIEQKFWIFLWFLRQHNCINLAKKLKKNFSAKRPIKNCWTGYFHVLPQNTRYWCIFQNLQPRPRWRNHSSHDPNRCNPMVSWYCFKYHNFTVWQKNCSIVSIFFLLLDKNK